MSNPTNITYGAYNFRTQAGPIPLLTIVKNYLRADDGTQIGSRYNLTLEGTLTPLPSGAYGYQVLDNMQDQLISGFDQDGKLFHVTCNGSTLISQYPRINSVRLERSDNNWTQTTPYTIDMEFDGSGVSGLLLDNVQETWNAEFDDSSNVYNWTINNTGDYNGVLVRLTHTVGAKGIPQYTAGGLTNSWQAARQFVVSRLGLDKEMISQSGVFNLDGPSFVGYNHFRVAQVDELGGTFNVTETWLALDNSGTFNGNGIEDFTATVRYSQDSALTTVELNGSIQGLETRSYGSSPGQFQIVQNKYQAASGFWNTIKPKLLGRAKLAALNTTARPINPQELNFTVGHNPTKGVITYGYSFDDRPCNFITGAIQENISVSDSYPADVFASIVVPGRGGGPILQDINTVTAHTRSVQIDVTVNPYAGCGSVSGMLLASPKSQFNSFLCAMEQQISGLGVQMFKNQDTDNWNPKIGRYTRTVQWTFSYCGSSPNTSFCS